MPNPRVMIHRVGLNAQRPEQEASDPDGMVRESDFEQPGAPENHSWYYWFGRKVWPVVTALSWSPPLMVHHALGVWAGSGPAGQSMGIDGALRAKTWQVSTMGVFAAYPGDVIFYSGSGRESMSDHDLDRSLAPYAAISIDRMSVGKVPVTIYLDASNNTANGRWFQVKDTPAGNLLRVGMEPFHKAGTVIPAPKSCAITRYYRNHPEVVPQPNTHLLMDYGPEKFLDEALSLDEYEAWLVAREKEGYLVGMMVDEVIRKFGMEGVKALWRES